ncbi:hypothetical protein I4F81_003674 [Pyropia yezoensis]|uniref:Uncharacterized protein n=1 Tax=Pyropia yezoensis TaxID=2788 RepID=A0ACC3BSZ9_PYRYE|nr:hypothetical protein I4F81_003674 [Neopyropia yezoensis]
MASPAILSATCSARRDASARAAAASCSSILAARVSRACCLSASITDRHVDAIRSCSAVPCSRSSAWTTAVERAFTLVSASATAVRVACTSSARRLALASVRHTFDKATRCASDTLARRPSASRTHFRSSLRRVTALTLSSSASTARRVRVIPSSKRRWCSRVFKRLWERLKAVGSSSESPHQSFGVRTDRGVGTTTLPSADSVRMYVTTRPRPGSSKEASGRPVSGPLISYMLGRQTGGVGRG